MQARRRAALARARRPCAARYAVETARGSSGKMPMMGICLGHQVLGEAFGAKSFKLKFGHRGANHPVRDEATGRVYITAQNHGYAIDDAGLSSDIEVSHRNVNDGTVEGLRHRARAGDDDPVPLGGFAGAAGQHVPVRTVPGDGEAVRA